MPRGIVKPYRSQLVLAQAKTSLGPVKQKVSVTRCYVELLSDFDKGLVKPKLDAIDALVDDIEKLLSHEENLFTTETRNTEAVIGL